MEFTVWSRRQCNSCIESHATNLENVSASSQLEEARVHGGRTVAFGLVREILGLGRRAREDHGRRAREDYRR